MSHGENPGDAAPAATSPGQAFHRSLAEVAADVAALVGASPDPWEIRASGLATLLGAIDSDRAYAHPGGQPPRTTPDDMVRRAELIVVEALIAHDAVVASTRALGNLYLADLPGWRPGIPARAQSVEVHDAHAAVQMALRAVLRRLPSLLT